MKQKYSVWVGFCDGKPHIYDCEIDGRCVAVYPSRAAARPKYMDIRRAELIIKPEKIPRRKSP